MTSPWPAFYAAVTRPGTRIAQPALGRTTASAVRVAAPRLQPYVSRGPPAGHPDGGRGTGRAAVGRWDPDAADHDPVSSSTRSGSWASTTLAGLHRPRRSNSTTRVRLALAQLPTGWRTAASWRHHDAIPARPGQWPTPRSTSQPGRRPAGGQYERAERLRVARVRAGPGVTAAAHLGPPAAPGDAAAARAQRGPAGRGPGGVQGGPAQPGVGIGGRPVRPGVGVLGRPAQRAVIHRFHSAVHRRLACPRVLIGHGAPARRRRRTARRAARPARRRRPRR